MAQHFVTQDRPATERQINFLRTLAAERQAPEGQPFSWAGCGLEKYLATYPPSASQASRMITWLMSLPKVQAPKTELAKLTPGAYRTPDGTLYRVYPARQHEGLLAKRIVIGEGWEPGDPDRVGFEYAGRADRFVKPEHRLTLEEAAAFGQQYGVCCECGKLLTDPDSVAAGIGPVCAGKETFR